MQYTKDGRFINTATDHPGIFNSLCRSSIFLDELTKTVSKRGSRQRKSVT